MTLFRFFLTLTTLGRTRMVVVSNGKVVIEGFKRSDLMHDINVSRFRNDLVYKWNARFEDGTVVIEAHV